MAKAGLAMAAAVAATVALSAQACTIAVPITLGVRASHHNTRADAEAARTGRRVHRHSVPARAIGGVLGGAAVDLTLFGFLLALGYSAH